MKPCPCGAEIVGRAVNARLCWECVNTNAKDDARKRSGGNKKPKDKTKPTGRRCIYEVGKKVCGKRTGNKGANYLWCDGHAQQDDGIQ